MAMQSMSMGQAKIGPSAWRNDTMKNIKGAQDILMRSDKTREIGRSTDPVPQLREVVAELSNDEAHHYFRQTRIVVYKLREALITTNEEVKSLTRAKEAIERAIDNTRKDLLLNQQSQNLRKSRPLRERGLDGADDLLKAEKMHLQNQKRSLETQLNLAQQQLQTLDRARKRLAAVISERSRVVDLVNAAVPSTRGGAGSLSARQYAGGRTSRGAYTRGAASADWGTAAAGRSCGNPLDEPADPLGAFTPEAEAALAEAANARERSALLRREAMASVGRADKVQQTTLKSVNDGLTGKLAETVSLKQNLDMAIGDTRNAVNRANRFYEKTEKAWNTTRGPLGYGDLAVGEKLDRPIIRTFQRHPGNNLPEAQEIVKAGDGLLQSLQTTGQNIGMLKLAQLNLKHDSRDKKAAIDVDSAIIRMRRRKANHRWVMSEAY